MGSVVNTITGNDSFRNKIINGNFDIWQRGTSQTATGYGSDDRWTNAHNGSTKTHSQQAFTVGQTDVPGSPRFFSRTVVTSVAGSGNYCLKGQYVEGVRTLAGQTATLSFWAKADASKNIAVEFSQNFGSGGSPSSPVNGIGVTTCALTSSWKKFTITVSIPSITGKTLGTGGDDCLLLAMWFDAGSALNSRTNSLGQQSGTFDIAQVQLEAGSTATAFEQRPIGMELQLCQRYYQNIRGSQTTTFQDLMPGTTADQSTWARYPYTFPVQMRIPPTLVSSAAGTFANLNGSGGQTGTSISINSGDNSDNRCVFYLNSAGLAAGQSCSLRTISPSAVLGISAEL